METPIPQTRPLLLAFVGMPGAGKTEAVQYIKKQDAIPFVRFGDLTEEGLTKQNLSVTTENERRFREEYRKQYGMAAYAIHSKPKIDSLVSTHDIIVIDGLYSWDEYMYLRNIYEGLVLIHVYAEPAVRYQRLAKRPVRPLTPEDARARDFVEVEKLSKGGPIAIADYLIENSGEMDVLYQKIDGLLHRLGIETK